MERKAQVKDYNYARVRRVLAETGQLKDTVNLKERKKQEKSLDSLINKEEGYNYTIDPEKDGVVHKKNDYWNRTEVEQIANIFPEEEVYNYKLAKKQLNIK